MAHRRSSNVVVLCLLVLLYGTARSSLADPVIVQSGGFSVDFGDPATPWRFGGADFSFAFHIQEFGSEYIGPFACRVPSCVLGSPIDLSTRYQDLYGVGDSTAIGFRGTPPAVFGGVTYPTLYYTGDISFDTALATVSQGRVEQPFTFSGHIGAFTNPSLTGPPVFDADLLGTGIALAVFGRVLLPPDAPPDRVGVLAISYSFTTGDAVVPEPSTIVLVGSMLGAAALRRRDRRGPMSSFTTSRSKRRPAPTTGPPAACGTNPSGALSELDPSRRRRSIAFHRSCATLYGHAIGALEWERRPTSGRARSR